jgi:subfamily B ATP-binding cassette protein MsbA
MGPIKRLARVNEHLQTGVAAAESVFGVLDKSIEETGGSKITDTIVGDIEFKNVTFQYEMTDDSALKEVSFRINRGETVALVGASGSGKTSIASLLLGFYRAQQGEILIDGTPIEDYQIDFLRSQIGFASQEAVLFDGSIESNVAYSAAQIDKKMLADVVEASRISTFSEKLPNSLKTAIGEQGIRLSGGQSQRLTIARALYRCAPILIMDEATSALDNVSESKVKEGIKTLSAERTVLIIAHRLSTVVEADRILVLQDGRLVEQGTHPQLLEMDGHYAELHFRQERGELQSTDHNA